MSRYESHVTVDKVYAPRVEALAKLQGWSYSVIAGCPLLGQGTYCYLTGYDTDAQRLKNRCEDTMRLLSEEGIEPLRGKIEEIQWDTKTGVDLITVRVEPHYVLDQS
jgi:hypothetical protein